MSAEVTGADIRTGQDRESSVLPIAAHILHDTSCTGGTKFNVIGRECCHNAETGDRRTAVCSNTAHSASAPADYADSEDHSYSVSDVDMKYIELEVVLIQTFK